MEILKSGVSYVIPIYGIDERGLTLKGQQEINFVKGSKDDTTIFKQNGVISEDLLKVLLNYIESVNVGHLKSQFGDKQEFHLKECLKAIEDRKQKRILEGTFQTYKK